MLQTIDQLAGRHPPDRPPLWSIVSGRDHPSLPPGVVVYASLFRADAEARLEPGTHLIAVRHRIPSPGEVLP